MSGDLVAASDTPMHRCSIEEMSDEQINDMIVNKRSRRMAAYNSYEESVRLEKETRNQKLLIELRKTSEMLEKKISTIDKALVAADKYAVKIVAIRNELGLQQHLHGDQNGSETTRDTDAPSEQGRSGGDNIPVCSGGGAASDPTDTEGDGGRDQSDGGHHADDDGSSGSDEGSSADDAGQGHGA